MKGVEMYFFITPLIMDTKNRTKSLLVVGMTAVIGTSALHGVAKAELNSEQEQVKKNTDIDQMETNNRPLTSVGEVTEIPQIENSKDISAPEPDIETLNTLDQTIDNVQLVLTNQNATTSTKVVEENDSQQTVVKTIAPYSSGNVSTFIQTIGPTAQTLAKRNYMHQL
ncbi:hypothetical protein ACQKMD_17785 [Viridibacillus sp. NPDC096237]|uniref:hypothetical protein n=1 Tax=Viridibacillus sp. NPDC096237 TaxID=3390721 RepID=UPI003D02EBF1